MLVGSVNAGVGEWGFAADLGVQHLLGAHGTRIEAVYQLRHLVGLTRATAVVAGVGATYTHGTGIDPTVLAR